MSNETLDKRRPDPLLSRPERIATFLVGLLILSTFIVFVLYQSVVFRILPGEAGVRYSLLSGGTVLGETIPEGIGFKLPWDRVYRYEVRTQRAPFSLRALSKDGMSILIEASVLFRPKIDAVPLLHKTIGPEYVERAVIPVVIASLREAAANQQAFTLYTEDFEALKNQVTSQLDMHPLSRFIELVDLAITTVVLPEILREAIEQKLAQEQIFLSFQYRLQSEEQEAQRRRVQAGGIRDFYQIVREALTPDLLTWRGIEATVQLAKSNNAKIVIVGGGADQLPLILGSDLARSQQNSDDVPESQSVPETPDFSTLPELFDGTTLETPQARMGATKSPLLPTQEDILGPTSPGLQAVEPAVPAGSGATTSTR